MTDLSGTNVTHHSPLPFHTPTKTSSPNSNSSVLQTQGVKLQDTGNQYTSVAEPEPPQSWIPDIRLFPDRISSRISGLSNPVLDIEKDYPATEPDTVSAQLDIWCISNF